MVSRTVIKTYKLNVSSLTHVKLGKLADLENEYREVLNRIKSGLEYWDELPKTGDLPFTKFNLHSKLYKGISRDSSLQSQQIIDAIRDAWAGRKDPCARTNHPAIPFNRPRSGDLRKTKKGNPVMTIALDKSRERRTALPIAKDGAWERLRNALDDGWVFTCFKLFHRCIKGNSQWQILVNLRKDFEVPDLEQSETVLGIDTGSGTPAAITIVDKRFRVRRQRYFGRDIAHRQRQVWKRRALLQKHVSKGSRKARQKLRELKGYETNMVRTGCYQVAHEIANEAREHRSIVSLEDLKGLNRPRKRTKKGMGGKKTKGISRKVERRINQKVHHIPYAVLREAIVSVCDQERIGSLFVDPRYTSQECSHCRMVEASNRKGRIYVCDRCGLVMDADRNASANIAMRPLLERPGTRLPESVSRRDGRVNGHAWGHDEGRKDGSGTRSASGAQARGFIPG